MTESVVASGMPPRGSSLPERWEGAAPNTRRRLQLALAAAWLLDAVLQYQPFMFTGGFPRMLAGAAQGNPVLVARPVTWSAGLIAHHLAMVNALFATVQLALGLGIAYRATARVALGASVIWALGVWWLGEGLGGVAAGTASPVGGAPGAVILYALLAVLLWPVTPEREAPFVAGWAVGPRTARAAWLVLWLSLAFFALQPTARAPQAMSRTFSAMAVGQPGWLAWLCARAAGVLAGQGLLASVLLAAALAATGAGVYLPVKAARPAVVLAVAVAAFLWLAEGLGGILTGGGTDPNSGPLLALLAVAYWPAVRPASAAARQAEPAPSAGGV